MFNHPTYVWILIHYIRILLQFRSHQLCNFCGVQIFSNVTREISNMQTTTFTLRCGIVSIRKICRLFRHLYQNYHCQWSPLVAKWWKVTIPHRTLLSVVPVLYSPLSWSNEISRICLAILIDFVFTNDGALV